jgi:hypothetical protein
MGSSNGSNSRLDRIEKLIEESERANKAAHARIERDLQRWVALGVTEARNQRKRSREIDEKITQLAAAQLVSEEKLVRLETTVQQFISSIQRGGNGHS